MPWVVGAAVLLVAWGCSGPVGEEHPPGAAEQQGAAGAGGAQSAPDAGPGTDATKHDGAAESGAVDARGGPLLEAGTDAQEDGSDANSRQDGAAGCRPKPARFVTHVVAHHFGPGQNFGQQQFPQPILGPPKGGGCCAGSTDVVSLGNGGWVIVAFDGNAIVDGPGPDFIVFENPFEVGGPGGKVFAELATVSVSEDGVHWKTFPCTATEPPYGSCAGWHPVYANADENDIDPTDPRVAGGDAFDLADVGLERARFVKITDREDITGAAGVFDLDAVSIVHPACP